MPDEEDEWVLLWQRGKLVMRRLWCDCKRKGQGYTKRDDGAWVRPCCMRREKAAWLKHGDGPVEHNPVTCRFCQERSANKGSPSESELRTTAKRRRK